MENFEESRVIPDKYRNMTYEIVNREMNLVYYILTDVFREEQEIQGLDKFDYFIPRGKHAILKQFWSMLF